MKDYKDKLTKYFNKKNKEEKKKKKNIVMKMKK